MAVYGGPDRCAIITALGLCFGDQVIALTFSCSIGSGSGGTDVEASCVIRGVVHQDDQRGGCTITGILASEIREVESIPKGTPFILSYDTNDRVGHIEFLQPGVPKA